MSRANSSAAATSPMEMFQSGELKQLLTEKAIA
jgi:hypothetical protein